MIVLFVLFVLCVRGTGGHFVQSRPQPDRWRPKKLGARLRAHSCVGMSGTVAMERKKHYKPSAYNDIPDCISISSFHPMCASIVEPTTPDLSIHRNRACAVRSGAKDRATNVFVCMACIF
jgi:hypothetical protein